MARQKKPGLFSVVVGGKQIKHGIPTSVIVKLLNRLTKLQKNGKSFKISSFM
jgi:hypothetical protein